MNAAVETPGSIHLPLELQIAHLESVTEVEDSMFDKPPHHVVLKNSENKEGRWKHMINYSVFINN